MILQVSDWFITNLKTSLSSLKFLYRKTGDLMDVLLANLNKLLSMTVDENLKFKSKSHQIFRREILQSIPCHETKKVLP